MVRFIFSFITCVLLLGCAAERYEKELNRLSNAREKWNSIKAANSGEYVFKLHLSCYCYGTDPVQITIDSDTIKSVLDIDSQKVLPSSDNNYYKTIDQWFDWIDKSLDEKPYSVSVTYDDTLGYPKAVFFDFEENVVDDEINVSISNVAFVHYYGLRDDYLRQLGSSIPKQ